MDIIIFPELGGGNGHSLRGEVLKGAFTGRFWLVEGGMHWFMGYMG